MKVETTINGARIVVDHNGNIYQDNKLLKQICLGTHHQYKYVTPRAGNKRVLMSVSRAVCTAFHGHPICKSMQVDHIDSDPSNNNYLNLRWTTRQINNSREHARVQRSLNRKRTSHKGHHLQFRDSRSGQTLDFNSCKEAASYLGCSTVAIYIKADTGRKLQHRWQVSWEANQ